MNPAQSKLTLDELDKLAGVPVEEKRKQGRLLRPVKRLFKDGKKCDRSWKHMLLDLWDRIQIRAPNECWPYCGSVYSGGYGIMRYAGKRWMAHRLAYVSVNGCVESDRLVCHHCDNPVCCNPRHLYAGTGGDNVHDMWNRGRNRRVRVDPTIILRMRLLWRTGLFSALDLAKLFQVGHTHVYAIVSRRSWAWIQDVEPSPLDKEPKATG